MTAVTVGSATLRRRSSSPGTVATIGLGAAATVALVVTSLIASIAGVDMSYAPGGSDGSDDGPSALALREIPPQYLRLYESSARRYGLDWAILAGIGKVECDHGRDPDPSCTREGAVNAAGAGGPMQFLASTWARYGVDASGEDRHHHHHHPDRWNPADAIYGAGNYLRAAGAPSDYEAAIYAYNHAGWYVAEVESWAAKYRGSPVSAGAARAGGEGGADGEGGGGGIVGGAEGGPGARGGRIGAADGLAGADTRLARETATPVRFIEGERARLQSGDGHVALIPAGVPAAVQALVVAGNELQDLPYGPGGHPDPRGAYEEDCSSTLNYVLYRAGIRPIAEILAENPLAQDYVSWGAQGPGRWVTIYATDAPTPHVFIVIAGLRLDTSHDGDDVGPNRDENGPRWRIFDRIPAWARWSVRHPPGL